MVVAHKLQHSALHEALITVANDANDANDGDSISVHAFIQSSPIFFFFKFIFIHHVDSLRTCG